MICSVEGCSKHAHARGICMAHYRRWMLYGHPLAGGPTRGHAQNFIEHALQHDGDECLIWPYARTDGGYAEVKWKGRMRIASRVVCEETHGDPPTPKHEAAHSCNNGHLGCVNNKHVSWKTKEENELDKIENGTFMGGETNIGAKLTKREVRLIRLLGGIMMQKEIGNVFGVGHAQVSRILSGKRWR